MSDQDDQQQKGNADGISTAYVLGGVPFLIFFFIFLFGIWVGGCDAMNVMVPF